ncbi:MAG: hypothetical protein JWO30_1204 [Fibrobacteres bacterium]|nr:hypothetical protein [Fibrobacterota bacterium]
MIQPSCHRTGFLPSKASIVAGAWFFLATLLSACRLSQAPETPPLTLSQKVSWNGKTASGYSDSLPFGVDTLTGEGPIRIHFLEFAEPDTVRLCLKEYRSGFRAYAAFQKSASGVELAQGFYRERNALVFQHGSYLGELEYARAGLVPASFLKENLSFLGEELFVKPREFAAFPLLGRIPGSERVISNDFLGRKWQGPVFTVSYRCHSDTGTAFRSNLQNSDTVKSWLREWQGKRDTLNWGREIHFQGLDEFHRSLIFWLFSEGVMGFSGCFDPVLAQEYAKKMKKTAVLWPKP